VLEGIRRRLEIEAPWLGKIHFAPGVSGKEELSAVIAGRQVNVCDPEAAAGISECVGAGVEDIPWIGKETSLTFPSLHL
jgi:hypothetical protein